MEEEDFLAEDVKAYDEQLQWQTTKMLPPRHSHAAVVAEMPFKHLLRDEAQDNQNWISDTDCERLKSL